MFFEAIALTWARRDRLEGLIANDEKEVMAGEHSW